MARWFRALALAVVAPLVLGSCFFMPGKFTSDLTIHADRTFTFTYRGEVAAVDLAGQMTKAFAGMKLGDAKDDADKSEDPLSNDSDDGAGNSAAPAEPTPEEKAKKEAEYREVAAALATEAGYRSVEYRGNGVFYVDYAISGTLTHGFVYPYNQDSAMIFPWVAIELRGKDQVRVKAPGFAKQDDSGMGGMAGMAGGDEPAAGSKMDGVFTLTTDAEIVSQNNEDGAASTPAGKVMRWKASPLAKDAPTAVLRVKAL